MLFWVIINRDWLKNLKKKLKNCIEIKKSLNATTEFNPATLKFRNLEKSCPRHKKPTSASGANSNNNRFFNIFSKPKFMLKTSPPSSTASTAGGATTASLSQYRKSGNASANLLANGGGGYDSVNNNNNKSPNKKVVDDAIDDLGQTNCMQCMAEDNSLNQMAITREQLYNQQSSPQFKFYILMCSLIFVSIMTVLLISDLEK